MNVSERFLNYVKYGTQSDITSSTVPSTKGQLVLAARLADELKALGITDAHTDENSYVYGHIPAAKGCSGACLALIAHLDTAMDMSGDNIKPRIIRNYDGNDIVLNEEKHIVTAVSVFPNLKTFVGQDLIVTDGTTLLGADDKAGVAEIMTLAEFLMQNPDYPHPPVSILFTPDEEIGRGPDHVNLEEVGAAYGYTIDGGLIGEFSYENFNAASAVVTIHGVTAHTGYAKGILKNAIQIAMEYQALLPAYETPACTENREGFYHLDKIQGRTETTVMNYLIRDHDEALFRHRQQIMQEAVDFINKKYGAGTAEITITESYRNMYEQVKGHEKLISNVMTAMEHCDITPIVTPIRGGTDGARLSYQGLPCPNICTGGQNGHGRHEFVSIQSMEAITEMLKELVKLFA